MKRNQYILIIIILIGLGLRLSVSYTHTYTNDELSAIKRLSYNTFSDLITKGVKIGDMHPAGVQLFMKIWSEIVGTSSFLMRLPFVLFGTAAIWLVYLIGNIFSKKTGLLAAGIWSFLLFPILQSELARPYAPGLFFTLLTGLFLIRLLFLQKNKKQLFKTSLFIGLSMAAAMYTHYFAFLMVGFMGLSSLLFIKQYNLKYLIFAGLSAIILYVPHVSITLYQTGIEGGIQWLAKPHALWLFDFLYFAFNESLLLITILLIPFLIGVFKPSIPALKKQTLLLFIWFFGIFLVGYILSYVQTPILKFPVMLFSFPFFVILISYYIQKVSPKEDNLLPIFISILVLLSTIIQTKPWSKYHAEVLQELHQTAFQWQEDISPKNLSIAMNVNDPFYINFFGQVKNQTLEFIIDELNYEDELKWKTTLDTLSTDYLIFGYAARTTPVYFFSIANHYYPYVKKYKKYNNSGVYLLSKKARDQAVVLNKKIIADFPVNTKNWIFKPTALNQLHYRVDSTEMYSPQILLNVTQEMAANKVYLSFDINSVNIDSAAQFTLVIAPENNSLQPILDANGNPIWIGLNLETALIENQHAYFSINCPTQVKQNDKLKIYIWNRNQANMTIASIKIEAIENIWN
ncbi:hypothetical protein DNU06_12665 [Putridiphycobacter roseus]|uniref:Glycosyltransferase RgtA/B/C/D-like domain-containing protein n=1 Tax=Putridiphycobacter roseus TaxID=2219161 RepID=A0A2W1MWY6_9FLAO|nr:glycosyltransferase family 39 protein [Putridiphycobacter roseus]PZE16397.1 hypothetical protein DNU06_12665 [Putridiphycobacter roseus]